MAAGDSVELVDAAARIRAYCRSALATELLADKVAAVDLFEVQSAWEPWNAPWDPSPPGLP